MDSVLSRFPDLGLPHPDPDHAECSASEDFNHGSNMKSDGHALTSARHMY